MSNYQVSDTTKHKRRISEKNSISIETQSKLGSAVKYLHHQYNKQYCLIRSEILPIPFSKTEIWLPYSQQIAKCPSRESDEFRPNTYYSFITFSLTLLHRVCICGPVSSVGIATELRAGRSGDRIPVGVRFSTPVQTGPGAHPASCTMGTGSFPGVNSGRGVTLTPHHLLVPWSWKGRSIPLLLWAVRPVQSLSALQGVRFPFLFHRVVICSQRCLIPLDHRLKFCMYFSVHHEWHMAHVIFMTWSTWKITNRYSEVNIDL